MSSNRHFGPLPDWPRRGAPGPPTNACSCVMDTLPFSRTFGCGDGPWLVRGRSKGEPLDPVSDRPADRLGRTPRPSSVAPECVPPRSRSGVQEQATAEASVPWGSRPSGRRRMGALSVERVTICDRRCGRQDPRFPTLRLSSPAQRAATLFNAKVCAGGGVRFCAGRLYSEQRRRLQQRVPDPPEQRNSNQHPRQAPPGPTGRAPAGDRLPPGSHDAPWRCVESPGAGRGRNNIQGRGTLCNRVSRAPAAGQSRSRDSSSSAM